MCPRRDGEAPSRCADSGELSQTQLCSEQQESLYGLAAHLDCASPHTTSSITDVKSPAV